MKLGTPHFDAWQKRKKDNPKQFAEELQKAIEEYKVEFKKKEVKDVK